MASIVQGVGRGLYVLSAALVLLVVAVFLYFAFELFGLGLEKYAIAFIGMSLSFTSVLLLILFRPSTRVFIAFQFLMGPGLLAALQSFQTALPFSSATAFQVGSLSLLVTTAFYARREEDTYYREVLAISTTASFLLFLAGLFAEVAEVGSTSQAAVSVDQTYQFIVSSLFILGSMDLLILSVYLFRFAVPAKLWAAMTGGSQKSGNPGVSTTGGGSPETQNEVPRQPTEEDALGELRGTQEFIDRYRGVVFTPAASFTRADATAMQLLLPNLATATSSFFDLWVKAAGPNSYEARIELDRNLIRRGRFDMAALGRMMMRLSQVDLALPVLFRIREYLVDYRDKVDTNGWTNMQTNVRLAQVNTANVIDHLTNERDTMIRTAERLNLLFQARLNMNTYRLQMIVVALAILAIIAPFWPSILKAIHL